MVLRRSGRAGEDGGLRQELDHARDRPPCRRLDNSVNRALRDGGCLPYGSDLVKDLLSVALPSAFASTTLSRAGGDLQGLFQGVELVRRRRCRAREASRPEIEARDRLNPARNELARFQTRRAAEHGRGGLQKGPLEDRLLGRPRRRGKRRKSLDGRWRRPLAPRASRGSLGEAIVQCPSGIDLGRRTRRPCSTGTASRRSSRTPKRADHAVDGGVSTGGGSCRPDRTRQPVTIPRTPLRL